MYMGDIKLFAKKWKRTENFNTCSYNIQSGHRDGTWHRKIFQANNEKRQTMDGIELPNQDKISTLGEKATYKYLSILEAEARRWKKKLGISQENQKATRDKTILQKPYQRNKYLGCTRVRYSRPFLKWAREELEHMDQRTRKLMTMHKALHPRDDVDKL